MSESFGTVLVIEDDDGLRHLLVDELDLAGYRAASVDSAEEGRRRMEHGGIDAVVCDIQLPGADGMSLLAEARRLPAPPPFIMITAFGTIPQAVQALKSGADDFLTKPVDLEYLLFRVGRVLHTRRLEGELARYREILGQSGFHGIIGRSQPMQSLFHSISQVAGAGGAVLVRGESGTGKELVARAIHRESPRRDGPFVAINCAGIPDELLESELFGHVSGAFSGAVRSRTGLVEEASGGTLLLDEIGEMPLAMQAKLLRVLEDGRVRPVGGNREREVDVRVVAATNRELESMIRQRTFREDLFFRLETFHLTVPPLRDREDDIELIAMHFLARFGAALGREIRGIDERARAALRIWPFPGNVRELSNAIERAVAFCTGDTLLEEHLPERMRSPGPTAGEMSPMLLDRAEPLPTLAAIEQRYVRHVLQRVDGNKQRAARVLGIGRRTLYRRLEEDDGA